MSGLIVIGGDGSLTMAQEFFEHGMAVVGGVVLALITMALHRVLFGPAVVSFGI